MSTLNFLGNVNIAHRLVTTGGYPDAKLVEVDAISQPYQSSGVTKLRDLNHLKCIFSTTVGNRPGVVFIETLGQWGEFGPPKYLNQVFGGDYVIPWPPADNMMEPTNARTLMVAAGYTGAFTNLTLRWPLSFRSTEPKYIFAMAQKGLYVLVGAISGIVQTSDNPEALSEHSKDEAHTTDTAAAATP